MPNVGYLGPDAIREYGPGDGAVLISASSTVGPGWALRHRFEQPRPYVHRWWFREEGYRAANAAAGCSNSSPAATCSRTG